MSIPRNGVPSEFARHLARTGSYVELIEEHVRGEGDCCRCGKLYPCSARKVAEQAHTLKHPLTEFYKEHEELARRVLIDHLPDEKLRSCRFCSTVRDVSWPCALRWHAAAALGRDPRQL